MSVLIEVTSQFNKWDRLAGDASAITTEPQHVCHSTAFKLRIHVAGVEGLAATKLDLAIATLMPMNRKEAASRQRDGCCVFVVVF